MLAHVLMVLLCGVTPLLNEKELCYVQTAEDRQRLVFLENKSENTSILDASLSQRSIPKIFHFIWLGPKPFPKESVVRMRSWLDRHPTWMGKFWTDQEHSLPDDRLEKMDFTAFPLDDLVEDYFDSDDDEERSQLLRYAILSDQGGVYVDPDLMCLKSMDLLVESYDFFCGLEPLGVSILSSSVNPSPDLIGSVPQHPVLLTTKVWLKTQWSRVGRQFPGKHPAAVRNRVKHRTFQAFNEGVFQGMEMGSYRNRIFSAQTFYALDKKNGMYAYDQGELPETSLKDPTRKQWEAVERKVASTVWWLVCLGVINLILGAYLFLRRRRNK